jgi:hypothetical protein
MPVKKAIVVLPQLSPLPKKAMIGSSRDDLHFYCLIGQKAEDALPAHIKELGR